MLKYILPLFIATASFAQSATPTPLKIHGCQPGAADIKEIHVYNFRNNPVPAVEPVMPSGNIKLQVILIGTPTPVPTQYVGTVPACGDPTATWFEVDDQINGPGVKNTLAAWALSVDNISSDASNTVILPSKKTTSPALIP